MARKRVNGKGNGKGHGGAVTAQRADSAFMNVLTGVGDVNDRRRKTTTQAARVLTTSQLTDIYRGGGLGRRVVDLLPRDGCRNWFTVAGDEDDIVTQKLEELDAQARITHAWQLGRLYGGALVVMMIDDGQELDQPVNEARIRDIRGLQVFDRRDVEVTREDISTDWESPRFMHPERYRVRPLLGGEIIIVHASRVIRFDGDLLGWREYQAQGYWHDSVLQTAYESLRQLGASLDSAEFMLEQFVIPSITIPGLWDTLPTADGEALLKKRIRLLDQSMHVANHVMLDSAEEYAKHISSVGGVSDLVELIMLQLCASSGYPATLLFGRSPAGENATGEADINWYYDHVKSEQSTRLRFALEPLIKYVFAAGAGKEPEKWSLDFRPLRQMSSKEMAELYKLNSEADAVNISNQVISPDGIAQARYVGAEYDVSPPTISEEQYQQEIAEREEAAAQEMERMKVQAAQMQQGGAPPAGDGGDGDEIDDSQE